MGNFNLTITNEGAAFLADVIVNHGTINFSEVRFSSTNYVGSEAGLTAGTFAGTFITAVPSASIVDGTTINVASSFTNATFTTDKSLYSIGVIADDGNGTDYLIAVATTSTPDILSKLVLSVSTYAYNINLSVSSTENITVTASTAGVVFVEDIVDNLTSENTNKPLSAKQGKRLKDLIDQHGGGLLPHIVISIDSGSTVTVTNGVDTITATETSSGVFEADVSDYGTWTITATLSGQTATDTLLVDAVKVYSVTMTYFAATITVTYPSGATCVLSANGQPIETATGSPYTFTVNIADTYTLTATMNGGSRTKTIVITTTGQTETVSFIVDGATVLTTDDVGIWLDCAYLWSKNYTTVAEVIADSDTLLALISDHNAVDYMVRSASFRTLLCADALAMLYIGQYNYCADALIADSTWLVTITNSEYVDLVLNVSVPVMTSDTTPSGATICNDYLTGYDPWRVFDKGSSMYDAWGSSGNGTNTAYIGYMFTSPVVVKSVYVQNRNDTPSRAVKEFKIQGSNDNSAWIDLGTFTNPSSAGAYSGNYVLNNNTAYQYYRLFVTDVYDTSLVCVGNLQFYGRSDVTAPSSRSLKTFAAATEAEILEMVCRADRGEIDLYDDAGWRVGQEHDTNIDAIRRVSANYTVDDEQPAQTATFVLMHKGLYELVNPVLDTSKQTRNTCSFIAGMKDCLNTLGYINSTATNTGSWDGCARRAWCNYGFRNSISPYLRAAFKQFKTITAQTYNGSTNQTSQDYFALPAEKEVWGSTYYSNTAEANALTQFTLYITSTYIEKKLNGEHCYWFNRSPMSSSNSAFCYVADSSSRWYVAANSGYGISPFGCL